MSGPKHTNINYKERREQIELVVYNVHDQYKGKSIEELQEIVTNDRLPFSVMCLNITGSLNIGTIIRSAHALGAERVFVVGRKCFDGRSMVGSHNYFPVIKIDALNDDGSINTQKIFSILEEYNMQQICVETNAVSYLKFPWNTYYHNRGHLCLIMGNEGLGIPEEIISISPCVSIPQKGVIRSINVSSAFSIVCSHMANTIWG